MNKRYFSRVDKTGAILLLEDLQKLVHAGKREVHTENGQLALKNPKPDYAFTGCQNKNNSAQGRGF